jgi:choline kinase
METNNIYSLWCAKEYLADEIILIEGDVLFDKHILEDLVNKTIINSAVVDDFRSDMDGTVVLEKDGLVSSMVLKSRQSPNFDYSKAFKTVNIYSFDKVTMQDYLIPALTSWVNEGFINEFYEAVIADLVEKGAMQLVTQHVGTRRWIEIDTTNDLLKAESEIGFLT